MENSWAQTLITVTPEVDGYLREITETTIISAHDDVLLNLDTENVENRQSLQNIVIDFVDPHELEKTDFKESECQTYMKGVPKVEYKVSYHDGATQTLYIGKNQPTDFSENIKNIVNVMNEKPLPKAKTSQAMQTFITVQAEHPTDDLLKILHKDFTEEEEKNAESMMMMDENGDKESFIESLDTYNFIVDRVLWISDTQPDVIETRDIETETIFQYNHDLKKFMHEIETQTSLTLEPQSSNSKLLDEYFETKKLVKTCLENCLLRGVWTRMMIDDFINEIVNKSCEIARLPMKTEAIQTIASYRLSFITEEDILKKLREPVIKDLERSSIVVRPILDKVMEDVSKKIRMDAEVITISLLTRLIDKVVGMRNKSTEIRIESIDSTIGPSIEQKLNLRRQKLAALMPKKIELDDATTQTGLAGVPEVKKLQKGSRVVRSDGPSKLRPKIKKTKERILRTEEILLTYNPCYIVVDAADVTDDMKNPCSEESSSTVLEENDVDDDDDDDDDNDEIISRFNNSSSNVCDRSTCPARQQTKYSAIAGGSCSIPKDQIAMKSSKQQISEALKKKLTKKEIEALEVLKNTFCSLGVCPGISSRQSPGKYPSQNQVSTNKTLKNPRHLIFCNELDSSESDECHCA